MGNMEMKWHDTKANLLRAMTYIAIDKLQSSQIITDFTVWDTKTIWESKYSDFPMFWGVSPYATILHSIGRYVEEFPKCESLRYDYVQHGFPFMSTISSRMGYDYYLLEADGTVTKVEAAQVKEVIRDLVAPVVEEYKKKHGLPKPKVKISFRNLSLDKVKAILKRDAEKTDGSLLKALKQMHRRYQQTADHVIKIFEGCDSDEIGWAEYVDGELRVYGALVYHKKFGWQSHT